MLPNTPPIPQMIRNARTLLAQAAEALRMGEETEISVRDRLALAERTHAKAQDHITREITKIVQKLDEDTLHFIQHTA